MATFFFGAIFNQTLLDLIKAGLTKRAFIYSIGVSLFVSLYYKNIFVGAFSFLAVSSGFVYRNALLSTKTEALAFIQPLSNLKLEQNMAVKLGFFFLTFTLAGLICKTNPAIVKNFYVFIDCLGFSFMIVYWVLGARFLVLRMWYGKQKTNDDLNFLLQWFYCLAFPTILLANYLQPENILERVIWIGVRPKGGMPFDYESLKAFYDSQRLVIGVVMGAFGMHNYFIKTPKLVDKAVDDKIKELQGMQEEHAPVTPSYIVGAIKKGVSEKKEIPLTQNTLTQETCNELYHRMPSSFAAGPLMGKKITIKPVQPEEASLDDDGESVDGLMFVLSIVKTIFKSSQSY